MSRSLLGYIIVMGVLTTPLRGQDLDRMARRVDSALRVSLEAEQSVKEYRAAHKPRLAFDDSIVIGGGKIALYFNPVVATLAHDAAAELEPRLAKLGTALDLMNPLLFSVAPDSAYNGYDERYRRTGAINVAQYFQSHMSTPNRTFTPDQDGKAIASIMMSAVATALRPKTASAVGGWINDALPLAADLTPKPDWGEMRLAVVSSPSRTGRACYEGDLKACRLFLELDSVADPARVLFDSAGRRRIVEWEGDRMRRASREAFMRCIDNNDEACITVMNIGRISVLAGPAIRSAVVARALSLGKDGALERLLTTRGSARESIAAAANMPLDSVISDWRRHLNERSGVSVNLPLTIAISSLVWIGICFFLAYRSSRWR